MKRTLPLTILREAAFYADGENDDAARGEPEQIEAAAEADEP